MDDTARPQGISRQDKTLIWLGAILVALLVPMTLQTHLGIAAILLFVGGLVLLFRPAVFLGVAMALYGSTQFLLTETLVVQVAGAQLNASRIYIFAVTMALALRLLIELVVVRGFPKVPPSIIASLALNAWMGIAFANSAMGTDAMAALARAGACTVAMLFAFVFVRSLNEFFWAWFGASITTVTASLFAVGEVAVGRGTESIAIGAHRAIGGFGGSVATATVAFFGLAIAAALLTSGVLKGRGRIYALIVMVISACGIMATFARTAILGALVFAMLFVFFSKSSARKTFSNAGRILVVAGLVLSFVVSFSLVSDEAIEARFSDLPGASAAGADGRAGSGRILIWTTLVELMIESNAKEWVFGHGLLQFPRDLESVVGLRLGAHNSYLYLLYDAGLIGLLLYLLFVRFMIKDLSRAGHSSRHEGIAGLLDTWKLYYVAFFLSTVMFNGYVYTIGARWYSMIIAGACLGIAAAQARSMDAPTR